MIPVKTSYFLHRTAKKMTNKFMSTLTSVMKKKNVKNVKDTPKK